MTVSIQEVGGITLAEVIKRSEVAGEPNAQDILRKMVYRSTKVQYGFIDGELACLWGIIQPTLLSEVAYFWLLTTDVVKEHTFVFIRASQRYIEDALKIYPIITGDTHIDNEKGKRWLRWLGAEYDPPVGLRVKFFIRRKPNG